MSTFSVALIAVAVLLLAAAVGYLLARTRVLSEELIPGISKILVYVCQPCLAIYTFSQAEFSWQIMKGVGIFAAFIILVHAVMLASSYLILKKRSAEPVYRIITIGTTFGNCAFFGIPIIEALLPESASGLILYTTVYAVVMNVIGWTVGSAIISRDAKYISLKKILVNPAMLGFVSAIVFFVLGVRFNGTYTTMLGSMIQHTARMATPLSMIVMGMRLSTMKLSELFSDYKLYLTVAVKQMLMPLVAFLIAFLLTGVDVGLRATFYITCACPVASIVLNYSEIIGEGQKSAANLVLLSTALSVITLPVMMLLLPLIA